MNMQISPAKVASKETALNRVLQSHSKNDPIFAMIERHRRDYLAYGAALEADNQKVADRLGTSVHKLGLKLVKAPATTVEGLIALLRYAFEFSQTDHDAWPNWDQDNDAPFDWSAHLNKSAADTLARITRN